MSKATVKLNNDQINITLRILTVAKHDIIWQLENTEERLPWVPAFLSNQLDELVELEKVFIALKEEDVCDA